MQLEAVGGSWRQLDADGGRLRQSDAWRLGGPAAGTPMVGIPMALPSLLSFLSLLSLLGLLSFL